jgi:signal transduction histidine kinase
MKEGHAMAQLKQLLKRHALWVGLLAVIVPLLVNLGLQYRSLVELKSILPTTRRAHMKDYLSAVAKQVSWSYRTSAEQVLSVPVKAFAEPIHPEENPFPKVTHHFEKYGCNTAKRLFVGTMGKMPTGGEYSLVLFYNPATRRLERDPDSPEWRAVHSACASWFFKMRSRMPLESPGLVADEQDVKNRVILKPIINEASQVVAITGMIVDEAVFKHSALPEAIEGSLSKYFHRQEADVIVTVHDGADRLVFKTQPFEGRAYEVAGALPFIFTNWKIGVRMRSMTEDQWASRYFFINLSLSLLTTLVLIGGIVLALRTASRAMKLSQMKADFVSNVSHELRTPLASIRVFGEFLKLGRVSERGKICEYGEYIETESRRLTQLINNILDFSKIESGQKTYQFESADLARVVADTLKTFEVRLEQSGFKIAFETPAQPLPPAVIDPNAITQALINLLDNAVKYSGTVKEIGVKLGQQDGYVTVAVTDHGIGISREEREKIFDKFYRVCTGLVHDVKGSGLGLSIVKHIADAHHGLVKVESEPGEGSTFTIFLPVDDSARPKPEAPDRTPTAGSLIGPEVEA